MASLDDARVLYRSPNGFLYAIPYEMRADIGQSPRDIYESTSHDDVCSRVLGAKIVSPGPRADWVWIRESAPSQAERAFLDRFADQVPQGIHEWCTIDQGDLGERSERLALADDVLRQLAPATDEAAS